MTYTITIPGSPIAKARPRVTRYGHAYTPKRTVDYERMVQTLFNAEHGSPRLEGPVMVEVDLHFGIAKSLRKADREARAKGTVPHLQKPDLDNCLKTITDALNGVAYRDDSQIIAAVIRKFWASEPRAEIRIDRKSVV